MSKHSDGGPAFARPFSINTIDGYKSFDQDGMTLLDYFAGQALAGIFANDGADDCSRDEIASDCYRLAEAMLAERERRMKEPRNA